MYYDSGSVALADVPKRRSVYLPEEANWVDFWTGRRWTGGQTVEADAPLDILPLFIREGSIVPLAPLHPNTDLPADAVLDIRVYWGASSTFVLYEDAGDGYGYERGEYSTITIAWDDPTATIVFGERQGQYPGMAATRVFRVVMVSEVNGVGVGFPEEPAVTVTYRGEALRIPMPKVDSVVEKGF
jgi:alpha-D-xyloside xylohydrolase